jgi:hypothetical protein
MRTTPKVLGVVGAGWIALGLGVLHFVNTTSQPFPVKMAAVGGSSHRTYPAGHESRNVDIHLVKQWLEGVGQANVSSCNECDHGVQLWKHNGGDCNACGSYGGAPPGHKVVETVKQLGDRPTPLGDEHRGCDNGCDHAKHHQCNECGHPSHRPNAGISVWVNVGVAADQSSGTKYDRTGLSIPVVGGLLG